MSALREIIASFGFEFDDKQLKQASHGIEDMIDKVKGLAGVIGGGLALHEIKEFIFGLTEQADVLAKQSLALGLSTEELQGWQHAAELSGASAETLTSAITRMQRAAGEAAAGGKEQAAAFAKLGVALKGPDGQLRSTSDLFEDSAAALGEMGNEVERNALAAKIFGRGFLPLIPLFKEGKEGIAKLRGEVVELGGGFSEDFAKASEKVNDDVTRLNFLWRSMKVQIVGAVLPAVNALVLMMIKGGKGLVYVAKHTAILQTLLSVLAYKGAAFLAMRLVGLIKGLGGVASALKLVGSFAVRVLIPLLALEDFLVFLSGGDSLFGRAIDAAFGEGSQEKVRTFISDVKAQFFAFVEDLIGNGWQHFKDKSVAILDGLLLALQIVWTELKFGFLGVVASVEDAFGGLWNTIRSGAADMLKGVSGLLSHLPGAGGLVDQVDGAIKSLQGDQSTQSHGEQNQQEYTQARLRLAAMGDDIAQRLAAPAVNASVAPVAGANVSGNVTTNNVVNVTVPPGTPASVARNVGNAAAAGVSRTTPTARETAAAMSFAVP